MAAREQWTQQLHSCRIKQLGLPRRGGLGPIPFMKGFVCSVNPTDPATRTNSLDMFCLATREKDLPSTMWSCAFMCRCSTERSAPRFHSFTHDFIKSTISAQKWVRNFISLMHQVNQRPPPRNAKRDQHLWGSNVRVQGKPCEDTCFGRLYNSVRKLLDWIQYFFIRHE